MTNTIHDDNSTVDTSLPCTKFFPPPTSDDQLYATKSKKRKAEVDAPGHVDKKAIILRPYSSPLYEKPTSLKLLQILDRSRLPLCYLDTSAATSALPQTRFYATYITDLEIQQDDVDRRLAIARLDGDKSLYALERIDSGVYAVCRLAHWVKLRDLRGEDAGRLPGRVPLRPIQRNVERMKSTVAGGKENHSLKDDVSTKDDVLQESCTKGSAADTGLPTLKAKPNDSGTQLDSPNTNKQAPDTGHDRPTTTRQVFEKLVCQYMETLYLSKTSLAFFAKGPLSKARASFTTSNGSLRIPELADFLRSICVSTQALEKKSREKVLEVIKEVPDIGSSDDDLPMVTPPTRKVGRRLHPTKAGLFPLEEDYIRRWWINNASTSLKADSPNGAVAKRAGILRTRETFLQVIITLEIMAIEASTEYAEVTQVDENQALTTAVGAADVLLSTETQAPPQKAGKKKQDLGMALDLLVDRLCIWQSIDQEGNSSSILSSRANSKDIATRNTPLADKTADVLRDFFTEVILPFYTSRLPQQVAALRKRLGGPAGPSPEKPSAAKPKPGAAIVRRPPPAQKDRAPERKPRSCLQRAPTDGSIQGVARAPSLVRFSSDSMAVAGIKRERSETPALHSIPLAEAVGRHSRSSSLANFKNLSKRQVDFTALNAATEAKMRKRATIDEQLKSAISTLKKPNRIAAVKEIVDFADDRKSGEFTMGRPVQVTATPRRVNKFVPATSTPHGERHKQDIALGPSPAVAPSSVVPSSVIRPPFADSVRLPSSVGHTTVQDTPSRGRDKYGLYLESHVAVKSISQSKSFLDRFGTRTVAPKATDGTSAAEDLDLFATPVKKKERASDTGAQEAGLKLREGRGSIYDALGWNDVDDEHA